jgi:hypothetical protein
MLLCATEAELIDAMQYALTEKILLNCVSPHMLCEIIKNITLCLPEDHELVAGVRSNNMYLYYEITEAADVHSFTHILNVPLKVSDSTNCIK